MTKRMGMHILENSSLDSIRFHHIRYEKSSETNSLIFKKRRVNIFFRKIVSDKKRGEVVVSSIKIVIYGNLCSFCKINHTHFSSLSSDRKLECIEIHISDVERGKLRDTKSSRIYTLGYSIISLSLDSFSRDSLKKSLYFFACKKRHFSVGDLHKVERGRIKTVDFLFF